ncbi:MAG: hypothetical protein H0W41_07960, partial [Chloroflexi bacterium]|nr:hypothetical protein [Chloroflexota bacterium]
MAITATQTTALTAGLDADNDGVADPGDRDFNGNGMLDPGDVDANGDGDVTDSGDTVTTTVTIANVSGPDATAVSFNEALNGMTLVPGSVTITPIAYDDVYQG